MNETAMVMTKNKMKEIGFFVLILWFQLSFTQYKIIHDGWQFSEGQKSWQTLNILHTWNVKDAFDDTPGYRRGLGYYKKQRIFDIYVNNELLQTNFKMAKEYPEKYGITKKVMITVNDENGLTISLKESEGKSVISGILVEKIK